jgi:hypothetical protein
MAALDIRPHSPRVSGWAVAGLMALGVSAFAAGMIHQIAPSGPLPFPPAQQATQATSAAQAPVLQYASSERPAHAAPAVDEIPPNTSASQSPAAVPDDAAPTPPAVDASATAADPAPPQAEPQPPADSAPPT